MTEDAGGEIAFKELFASIDAMDVETFLGFLHEKATFRFGSSQAVSGHTQVRAAVEGFFASIKALKHELRRTVSDEDAVVCEGEVTYTRHDGSEITLPFANIFQFDEGLISHYRIYIDISPLYAG